MRKPNKKDIVNQYSPMIHKIVHKLHIKEHDDAFQIGVIALFKAWKLYDVNKNYKFSTCAWTFIYNELRNYRVTYDKSYGRSASFYRSHTTTTLPILDVNLDLKKDITEKIDINAITKLFIEELNTKYDENMCELIIDYYLEGLTFKELRLKYGNCSRALKKLDLKDVFEKVKTQYQNEYE